MSGAFYGVGGRADYDARHYRFQRHSATQGNWSEREAPLSPIWLDLGKGFLAGLIILPPFFLYALPFLVAVLRAVTDGL